MSNQELIQDQEKINKIWLDRDFCNSQLSHEMYLLLEKSSYHVNERRAPIGDWADGREMAELNKIEAAWIEHTLQTSRPISEDSELEKKIEAFSDKDHVHALFVEHGMMASDVFRLLSVSIDGLGNIESENVNSEYGSELILRGYAEMSQELAKMADKAA